MVEQPTRSHAALKSDLSKGCQLNWRGEEEVCRDALASECVCALVGMCICIHTAHFVRVCMFVVSIFFKLLVYLLNNSSVFFTICSMYTVYSLCACMRMQGASYTWMFPVFEPSIHQLFEITDLLLLLFFSFLPNFSFLTNCIHSLRSPPGLSATETHFFTFIIRSFISLSYRVCQHYCHWSDLEKSEWDLLHLQRELWDAAPPGKPQMYYIIKCNNFKLVSLV